MFTVFNPSRGTGGDQGKNASVLYAVEKFMGLLHNGEVSAEIRIKYFVDVYKRQAKEFWGLGIGWALINACIECAGNAGYTQLELSVVAENTRAISMYERAGFVEFGRNPKGFNSRTAGFQELIYMRREL